MSKLYTIQEKTLTKITDAIRRKYNFDEKIKVSNIPLYISNDSNLFWVIKEKGKSFTTRICASSVGACRISAS